MEKESPPSERRETANQANAQHSTGPRTAFGKQVSSQNATKHGLTGRRLLAEEVAAYERLVKDLKDDLDGTLTRTLLEEAAFILLRLHRAQIVEAALIAEAMDKRFGIKPILGPQSAIVDKLEELRATVRDVATRRRGNEISTGARERSNSKRSNSRGQTSPCEFCAGPA
jgi:hypothetical protein